MDVKRKVMTELRKEDEFVEALVSLHGDRSSIPSDWALAALSASQRDYCVAALIAVI